MSICSHLKECEFVLTYVVKAKPHWDDFVSHYCNGTFQDVCQRLKWFQESGTKPPASLMPTGFTVPGTLDADLDSANAEKNHG